MPAEDHGGHALAPARAQRHRRGLDAGPGGPGVVEQQHPGRRPAALPGSRSGSRSRPGCRRRAAPPARPTAAAGRARPARGADGGRRAPGRSGRRPGAWAGPAGRPARPHATSTARARAGTPAAGRSAPGGRPPRPAGRTCTATAGGRAGRPSRRRRPARTTLASEPGAHCQCRSHWKQRARPGAAGPKQVRHRPGAAGGGADQPAACSSARRASRSQTGPGGRPGRAADPCGRRYGQPTTFRAAAPAGRAGGRCRPILPCRSMRASQAIVLLVVPVSWRTARVRHRDPGGGLPPAVAAARARAGLTPMGGDDASRDNRVRLPMPSPVIYAGATVSYRATVGMTVMRMPRTAAGSAAADHGAGGAASGAGAAAPRLTARRPVPGPRVPAARVPRMAGHPATVPAPGARPPTARPRRPPRPPRSPLPGPLPRPRSAGARGPRGGRAWSPYCCGGTGWRSLLIVAGVALRLLAQFSYGPALLYIDSVKYLYDAWPGGRPARLRRAAEADPGGRQPQRRRGGPAPAGPGHGGDAVPGAGAPRRAALAGRAGHGAGPAGRLPAPDRVDDHARRLVRGRDRGRGGRPALAAADHRADVPAGRRRSSAWRPPSARWARS